MDKMKPCYLGPMIILRRTHNGTYRLGKLDSAMSWLCYTAFCLIPYHAHSPSFITVTHIVDGDNLVSHNDDNTSVGGAGLSNDKSTWEGQYFKTLGGVMMAYALSLETSHVILGSP